MAVYNYQLSAPSDQARCHHDTNGTLDDFYGNDDFIIVGRPGDAEEIHTAGIVMPLDIPHGAVINSAELLLFSQRIGLGQGSKTIRVYADADLTQANFTGADVPSAVNLTEAYGSITNPPTAANEEWGPIDITEVLQEIVDDPEWEEGMLVRFVLLAPSPGPYIDARFNGAGAYSNTSNEPAISVDWDEDEGGDPGDAEGDGVEVTATAPEATADQVVATLDFVMGVNHFFDKDGQPITVSGLTFHIWRASRPSGNPDQIITGVDIVDGELSLQIEIADLENDDPVSWFAFDPNDENPKLYSAGLTTVTIE